MAINTYATLVSAVEDWLAREDITDQIPNFIALCEAKLNRRLMHPRMEAIDTLTVDTNLTDPEYVDLPADFQTMRSLRLSGVAGKPRLQFMTQTQMDDYRYTIDNVTDQPGYFSILGDQIELAPTPNEDYDLEIKYRANIPALTASNPTNWLLTLAPDIYLYGALLESAAYSPGDPRLSLWAEGFQTVLGQLETHGERQSFDSGPSTVTLPGVCP